MKKSIPVILSLLFGLFTFVGLIGVIISLAVSDSSLMAFYIVWTVLGAVLLFLPLKKVFNGRKKKPDKSKEEVVPAKEETSKITVPKSKNGIPLAYHYSHQLISQLDFGVAMEAAENNSWELSAFLESDVVFLYSGVKKIGFISGKLGDMIKDWIQSGEPFLIYLENIDTELKVAYAFLAFYRDKRAKMAYREQTTVKLIGCNTDERQLFISSLRPGDELELSEDCNLETGAEYVSVCIDGVEIGRLPKKICERYLDEGAAACFIERIEDDPDKDTYVPFVTIYW